MDQQQIKDAEQEQDEDGSDPRLAQANKLFQTAVMLIYGRRKSVERAIKCVQRAIVLDDSNYKHWQLLGEAYYQRGSLNPAINCFIKSLDRAELHLKLPQTDDEERALVQADCSYSRLRMSDIRLSVSHLEEAMQGYYDIISADANNVAALTGLSKTRLQFARNCFSSGLVKSGHEHCMEALRYALKATCLCPHLCFTWKLASDCCLIQILYGQRGQFRSTIQMPGHSSTKDGDGLIIDQVTCVQLAQQFLCKALAIDKFKDSTCLWHNLGVSLYLNFKLIDDNRDKNNDLKRSLLKRSLKCLFKALNHDRSNSQVRNSIALVAFHLNLLNTSQSFLIKSIQKNMSTSEMQFSNLGYIYLQKGEFRLASVAFRRSQAEEPLYCRSWLGNALLSEQSNSDNMTFLRHCHKLENNYESQLMYATRVVTLPYVEDYDKDLINALDCMKRIINYNYLSLESQNTLGLLLERSRFSDQAKECFETAYAISATDSRVVFNKLRQIESNKSCLLNETESEIVKSAEKLADSGNRDYMLNFIYYLFRNGLFQSINQRVTKVIEKLPQEKVSDKIGAQILLAMSDKVEGRDFKSWLFKNIIDSEGITCVESMISLFCLMLFGSMTRDQNLVRQVGSDLMKCLISYLSNKTTQFADLFYSLEGYWTRLLLFSSIFIDEGEMVRPLVALFPMIPDLWLYLGLSFMPHNFKSHAAEYCIKKASLIGSADANLTAVCDMLLAIMSTKNNSSRQASKEARKSSRSKHLSRAIFRCPNSVLLWDCLVGQKQVDEHAANRDLFQLAVDQMLKTMVIRNG